jgi:hypothetical protein
MCGTSHVTRHTSHLVIPSQPSIIAAANAAAEASGAAASDLATRTKKTETIGPKLRTRITVAVSAVIVLFCDTVLCIICIIHP